MGPPPIARSWMRAWYCDGRGRTRGSGSRAAALGRIGEPAVHQLRLAHVERIEQVRRLRLAARQPPQEVEEAVPVDAVLAVQTEVHEAVGLRVLELRVLGSDEVAAAHGKQLFQGVRLLRLGDGGEVILEDRVRELAPA